MKTMQAAVDQSVASRRAIALWLAAFAAIALTLAVGGIYAVLSYVVGRRRHEIGIRMALGAQTSQVLESHRSTGRCDWSRSDWSIGVPSGLLASRALSKSSRGGHASRPAHLRRRRARSDRDRSDRGMDSGAASSDVDPKIAFSEGS